MKKIPMVASRILPLFAISIIIFHIDTVRAEASDAVTVCLEVIIPTLLPFIILSSYLSDRIIGYTNRPIDLFGRIFHIPSGFESIYFIGLISGYPIGAKNIADLYHSGKMSKQCANRLMLFCCNAGPAFIIGMTANMFRAWYISALLFFTHILSSILVAVITPKLEESATETPVTQPITFVKSLEKAAVTLPVICCWVIFFRIVLSMFRHYTSGYLSSEVTVLLTGLLEMTNGILFAADLPVEGMRFVISAGIVSFGGICVLMQTASVCAPLSIKNYCIGKLLQTAISVILAYIIQSFLFPLEDRLYSFVYLLIPFLIILLYITANRHKRKKL